MAPPSPDPFPTEGEGEALRQLRGIAIERNRDIVPKSAWDACVLEEGDRLEMVVFVGGG